eukprot:1200019-Prymnesium_polylepis.1
MAVCENRCGMHVVITGNAIPIVSTQMSREHANESGARKLVGSTQIGGATFIRGFGGPEQKP